jgi:hypothetical protein
LELLKHPFVERNFCCSNKGMGDYVLCRWSSLDFDRVFFLFLFSKLWFEVFKLEHFGFYYFRLWKKFWVRFWISKMILLVLVLRIRISFWY